MNLVVTGAMAMALGIGLGAFGAHGLQDKLSEKMMSVYQTGVLYHLIHGLGLILTGVLFQQMQNPLIHKAGVTMGLGIVLFSGSLYALSLSGISKWGMITPLGGLLFIASWVMLAAGCLR